MKYGVLFISMFIVLIVSWNLPMSWNQAIRCCIGSVLGVAGMIPYLIMKYSE